MAMGFAERRFRLEVFGINESFDHDLRFRRNREIDGARLDHVDGRPHEPAGERYLVDGFRCLLHRCVGERWRHSDYHCRRHRLPQGLVFQPMQIAAGLELDSLAAKDGQAAAQRARIRGDLAPD